MENAVEIDRNSLNPVPWAMLQQQEEAITLEEPSQLNPDIEEQIKRIAQIQIGDLFLTDSQRQLDMLRSTGLASREFTVCFLTLSMLVPWGNPHGFASAKDVLDAHARLGIMDPSFDGLGEASWQVLSQIVPGGAEEIPMHLVHIYERQYDLLEALEYGNIDAALVWDATSQISFLLAKYAPKYYETNETQIRHAERRRDRARMREIAQTIHLHIAEEYIFAEEVQIKDNPGERHVVPVQLVALGSTSNIRHCIRFADFMRSTLAREIMRRYGFVTE